MILLLPHTFILFGFFNLLTLSVPDVTPGCFSIFWLWAYLTLLQDVFQSFDFERTWRYSIIAGREWYRAGRWRPC